MHDPKQSRDLLIKKQFSRGKTPKGVLYIIEDNMFSGVVYHREGDVPGMSKHFLHLGLMDSVVKGHWDLTKHVFARPPKNVYDNYNNFS